MYFLLIFILFIIMIIIIYSLSIKFEINNLKLLFPKLKNSIINKDSKICLKIYILKIIKIAEFDLKKIDIKDKKIKSKLQKYIKEKKYNLDVISLLRSINYIVEELNLNIYLGTEDSAITAISVGIIYTIISNLLNSKIKNTKNIRYEVNPVYEDKNMLKIRLDSIIILKFESIINIIKYLRKGSVDKNARSSNRKSYAYSNE